MKKFNFAITDNTVYTGKDAFDKFYSAALLSAPSIQSVTLVPNVKSSIKLTKFDLGNILQAENCTFSGTGEGTLAQKTFEVCPIKINLSYCRSTFEQNYMNEFMRPGFSDEVMPALFSDYILSQVGKTTAQDVEKVMWKGVGSGSTYPIALCEGLESQLAADADVIDVTAVTITSANVIAELQKVYDAIPATVINKPDLRIFVSTKVAKLYKQAVAAASAEAYYTKNADLTFLGVQLVEAPGMSDNKMVAAATSNLVFLTDLMSDWEDVLLLPMRNVTGEPTVRFVANFKIGFGYLYGAEIVYHN